MADPVTIWTLDWVPETPRGFVRDLEQDSDDAAIVSAIVALGQALGLRIVAEGVSTFAVTPLRLFRGGGRGACLIYAGNLVQALRLFGCARWLLVSR